MKTTMKTIGLALILALSMHSMAQKKPVSEKVVKASEKVNKVSKDIHETSDKIKEQSRQISDHTKSVVNNVREIAMLFEPILFHFTKKKKNYVAKSGGADVAANEPADTKQSEPTSSYPYNSENANNSAGTVNTGTASQSMKDNNSYPADYGVPANKNYNADGTLNWGHNNSATMGYCLNALLGEVCDAEAAKQNPKSVDLIFLAPNDGQNAYYLVTPGFAQSNGSADCFWGGCTTDNPVKAWAAANESEIAVTSLSGEQFLKIKTSSQVKSAVRSARNFAPFYSSTSKLEGRVFALKTEMDDRETYALIYVVKHYGTSGSSGYLKIMIKCPGFDNNGDNYPDYGIYSR